ncbi:dual-specificity tyrosine-(Y)-phosphorylation regulated kinase [Raphidocelis subcapitata]|uniref:dual-specificity kinase n=1 Tax=Raphidocelis subcapitata TaxID=307507 RepID=A0A2V0P198_9CHLO|nr:dual-specificity tyrosine-(Y)-phosphorylation regulated kinase [Raphidocelis subcapitata]|eukprot:GBF91610.1 dual-specificity tyrosine-(Y)-phosphorylation regulated kinase [Raphidocelis subcapitata]
MTGNGDPVAPSAAMGNSYASAKLPNLNSAKLPPSDGDNAFLPGFPHRAIGQLSGVRLPGAARKMPPMPVPQPLAAQALIDAAGPDALNSGAKNAVARLAKPTVPVLSFGADRSEAASGGLDQSFTSLAAGHVAPGALAPALAGAQQQQQQQAQQQQPRSGPGSARSSSYAAQHQQQQQAAAAAAAAVAAAAAAAAQQQQQQQQQQQRAQSQSQSSVVETGPITPAQALKRYSEYLTPFEQSEVLQYNQVWFLGKADVAKIRGNPHAAKTNYGYDDERGDYVLTMHDHIGYRFEVLGVLGKGSFGQVLKVLDYKTGAYRALKIIRNKKRFHHQAQVELRVLEHLRAHDPEDAHNVIHLSEHFMFRSHLCITFEMLSINLYEFIKQNNFAGLSLNLVRRFGSQMLQSLKFLRRHRLIHCDLKPENVLLRSQHRSAIKVIDFGSSCFQDERVYTYIQSRFYRSPEVILGLPYGCEIDMWSFGCILAELLTGYPLFPGEDETEQLACIMEVMGLPPRHLLDTASRRKMFFDSGGAPRLQPNSRGKVRTPAAKALHGVLRCNDAAFLELLEGCLRWDPAERITPEQALAHPWFGDQAAQAVAQQQAAVARTAAVKGAAGAGSFQQQQAAAPMMVDAHTPRSAGAAAAAAAAAASAASDTTQAGTDVTPRGVGLPSVRGAAIASSGCTPRAMDTDSPARGPLGGVVGGRLHLQQQHHHHQQQRGAGLDAASPKRVASDQVPLQVAAAAAKALGLPDAGGDGGLFVAGQPALAKGGAAAANAAAAQQQQQHHQQQQAESSRSMGMLGRLLPHLRR